MKKLVIIFVSIIITFLTSCHADQSISTTNRPTSEQSTSTTQISSVNSTEDGLTPILTLNGEGGGLILLENEANGDYNFEIFIMNADGSSLLQLTDNPSFDGSPNFSPDLNHFVFCSDRSGNMQLYLYHLDEYLSGKEPTITQLTFSGNNYYPAWAPNNSAIAFVSDRDGSYNIYKMNIDGSNQELLVAMDGASWFPSWSPDSSQIVFSSVVDGSKEIFTMDTFGEYITRLTFNDKDDQFASWSPDGEYIVFSRINPNTHFDIYIMDSNGDNLTSLVNHWGLDEFPIFSPDGTQILFRSSITGSDQLTLMNIDGTGSFAITDLPGMSMPRDWRLFSDNE